MSKKHQLIAIEGNTGCGKTSVMNWLSTFPDLDIQSEPVEIWRDFVGYNVLGMRYSDPQRWSFTFQNLIQLTRLKMYSGVRPEKTRIIERSLHSNRYCFLENARDLGHLNDVEFTLCSEWFTFFETNFNIDLDLIVYLRTSPEMAMERIQERNRSEEKGVTLESLQKIHDKYEYWIGNGGSGYPVIVIDADQSSDQVQKSIENHLKHKQILH